MHKGATMTALMLLLSGGEGYATGPSVRGGHERASSAIVRVVDLPLVDGGRQRVLFMSPAAPRGVIVMLPGGTGRIGISRDGTLRHDENFVVRTRDLWLAQGYAVLVPDTVDGLNLRPLRASRSYATVVDGLVALAFRMTRRPVALLGTSQGTIAATNAASRIDDHAALAALILLETVSRPGRKSTDTVFDAAPERVRVPTLVLANEKDGCNVASPDDVERVAAAFSTASKVTVMKVDGGRIDLQHPCSSSSPHGYAGIESNVVERVGGWLATLPPFKR